MRELENGLESGNQLWEDLSAKEVLTLVKERYMVSPPFVHWDEMDEDGEQKGRFVQNFKRQSE
jgi:hypothetical protein